MGNASFCLSSIPGKNNLSPGDRTENRRVPPFPKPQPTFSARSFPGHFWRCYVITVKFFFQSICVHGITVLFKGILTLAGLRRCYFAIFSLRSVYISLLTPRLHLRPINFYPIGTQAYSTTLESWRTYSISASKTRINKVVFEFCLAGEKKVKMQ